ncbi:Poly-gamma-glutamate capsule biosynthesis protein CapA [uncultured virus]|nr:Poly-gamma-glutamate capsule biosynthesis protein CapA [uncultured virus]
MTTITFTGDMMLGRSFDAKPVYPWSQDVLDVLNGTLLCTNLETAVTTATTKYPGKAFNFKVAPSTFASLLPKDVAMAVNLANNHVLDYKEAGMIETLKTLDELGIPHTGAGASIDKAREPAIFKYGDLTVGMLGFADHYAEWAATETKAGISYLDIGAEGKAQEEALDLVASTAKRVDVLIVYLHYGPNWAPSPSDAFVKFNHALIDHGAAIVAGTSPHHLQQIEAYGKGMIFFSLGDFIDDYAIDATYRNDLTILAQVTFNTKGGIVGAAAYPAKIEDMQLRLLQPEEEDYAWVTKRLATG